MDRAALRAAVIELLEANVGKEYDDLDDRDDLRTGLGLDSVDLVTLVIEIQSRFNILIPSEELSHLTRVGDLLDLLQDKVAACPRPSAA